MKYYTILKFLFIVFIILVFFNHIIGNLEMWLLFPLVIFMMGFVMYLITICDLEKEWKPFA